jgi:methionyl-tRNA formyltransferase
MKFVFFGTPFFSARTLEKLLDGGMIPVAAVSNPDRPAGRKKILTAPPVKTAAEAWSAKTGRSIEIFQPEKLDADAVEHLQSLDADLFVVFAYNKIFRKTVLDIPRLGTIGIHPSLLPKYRGPSPFQSAILNGERETGVTLYLLNEGIDSGPILVKSSPIEITDSATFTTMADELADIGAQLLLKIIPDFIAGKIQPRAQAESQATYTKKFKTEDGFVAPEDLTAAIQGNTGKADSILRKMNALNPEPGAWTTTSAGKRMKLLKAKIEDGRLVLRETQLEGEKPKQP